MRRGIIIQSNLCGSTRKYYHFVWTTFKVALSYYSHEICVYCVLCRPRFETEYCFMTAVIAIFENGCYVIVVAVVVAFFICWAPFHAQRLMTIYIREDQWTPLWLELQSHLFYISGIISSECISNS